MLYFCLLYGAVTVAEISYGKMSEEDRAAVDNAKVREEKAQRIVFAVMGCLGPAFTVSQ